MVLGTVYDLVNGASLARLAVSGKVGHLTACHSPDVNALVAVCNDGRVTVWREDDYTVAAQFNPTKTDQKTPATAALCSPIKPLLFYARDGRPTIYILHLLGERPMMKIEEGRKTVTALACHPRRPVLVAGYSDGVIRVYDYAQVPVLKYAVETEGTRGAIVSLDFHALREVIVAVHADGVVSMWSLGLDAATPMGFYNPLARALSAHFSSTDTLVLARTDATVCTATFTGIPNQPVSDDGSSPTVVVNGLTGLTMAHAGDAVLALGVTPRVLHLLPRVFPNAPCVLTPQGRLPVPDPGRVVWASTDGVFQGEVGGASSKLFPYPSSASLPPSVIRASTDASTYLLLFNDARVCRLHASIEKPALVEARDAAFVAANGARFAALSVTGTELAVYEGSAFAAQPGKVPPPTQRLPLEAPCERVFATPLRDGAVVALFSRAGARLYLWGGAAGSGQVGDSLFLQPREDVLEVVFRAGVDNPPAAVLTTQRVLMTDCNLRLTAAAPLPVSGHVHPPSAIWLTDALVFSSGGGVFSLAADGTLSRLCSTPHADACIATATLTTVVLARNSMAGPVLHMRGVGWLQAAGSTVLGRPHTKADVQNALRRYEAYRVAPKFVQALTRLYPTAALTLVLRLPALRFPLAMRVAAAVAANKPGDAASFVLAAAGTPFLCSLSFVVILGHLLG